MRLFISGIFVAVKERQIERARPLPSILLLATFFSFAILIKTEKKSKRRRKKKRRKKKRKKKKKERKKQRKSENPIEQARDHTENARYWKIKKKKKKIDQATHECTT